MTSSNPTAGDATIGTSASPTAVGQDEVVSIVKSYLPRAGEGPIPTELKGDDHDEGLAEFVHEKGSEFGTITGRPHCIGWLDMPMFHHAAHISGFTGITVNHLDMLAGLGEIKVGHAYKPEGEERLVMPVTTGRWGEHEPVLEEFDVWPGVSRVAIAEEGYSTIPDATQDYLEYLSGELDVPIYAVGIDPGREQMVYIENPSDN